MLIPEPLKLLAFDTSTDHLSVAVTHNKRIWQHNGPGGALASTQLIPTILALLTEAGLTLNTLDAIVFGRGPGSFTGLRTACAVAQGLALGAKQGMGIPVLPVDTLMAIAEEARLTHLQQIQPAHAGLPSSFSVTALLDARMDEMYVQRYEWHHEHWHTLDECSLIRPENWQPHAPDRLLAGNVFEVYAPRLPANLAELNCVTALPTASALLRLAPGLFAAGHCMEAALALPLYVRDKVAFTTDERAQLKRDADTASKTTATLAS